MLKSIIIAALLASSTGTAFAAPPAEHGPSITISYADLDLGRPAGRTALARRIRQGIATLCGDHMRGTLAERMAAARCARETGAQAEAATALAIARSRSGNRLAAR